MHGPSARSGSGLLGRPWARRTTLSMTDRVTAESLPGTLYMLVLRTLAAGPLHGYAIAKRVKEASREGISIEDGSLYPSSTACWSRVG
jgi:Transcriptional regulator PadR-like family